MAVVTKLAKAITVRKGRRYRKFVVASDKLPPSLHVGSKVSVRGEGDKWRVYKIESTEIFARIPLSTTGDAE
jgi:hypothetical protein